MMISKKQVEHIAKLARIKLDKKEIDSFQKELSSILDYFNLLKDVDVSGIKPFSYFKKSSYSNLARKDKRKDCSRETINKLISLVPEKRGRFVKIKNVFYEF